MAKYHHSGIHYSRLKADPDYRYRLEKLFRLAVELYPQPAVGNAYLWLSEDGQLRIRRGYRWDGPSGLGAHPASMLRASLVHDALYQLIREGKLRPRHRIYADQVFRELCEEDGLGELSAGLAYWAVRKYAAQAARPL